VLQTNFSLSVTSMFGGAFFSANSQTALRSQSGLGLSKILRHKQQGGGISNTNIRLADGTPTYLPAYVVMNHARVADGSPSHISPRRRQVPSCAPATESLSPRSGKLPELTDRVEDASLKTMIGWDAATR
jgi:hypothetical protein